MCLACNTSCTHSLKECAAMDGEYCIVCHHESTMPSLSRRRATPPGSSKARPSLSALLREIRQRRGRRRA